MKHKIFFAIFTITALFLNSCDEDEDRELFNPNPNNSETIIGFASATGNLNLLANEEGSIDVTVTSTTVSDVDRQINLVISEESTADPIYYNVPTSVTIPANEFIGTFTVQGMDPVGEQISESLIITTDNSENSLVDDINITIAVLCPVGDEEFVGDYMITNNTAVDFGNIYAEGTTVTITAGEDLGVRMFDAVVLEDLGVGQAATPLVFGLVCNSVIVSPEQITNLACGGESLFLGPALGDITGQYTTGDDTTFNIVIGYNEGGLAPCAVPSDAVITLTRI